MAEVRTVERRSKVNLGVKPHRLRSTPLARTRRYRSIMRQIARELGLSRVTTDVAAFEHAELAQCAALMLRVEESRNAFIRGEPLADADELIRLSSEVRRLLASLRKHVKRPPTLPLDERLAAEVEAEAVSEAVA